MALRIDVDAWAAVYDSDRPSAQEIVFRRGAEIARRACLAAASSGQRWLDAGCGPGHLTAALATAGLATTGVDADPAMVAYAVERFGAAGARYELADVGRLPYPDASFDGVVATSLVGLLPDPTAFLGEAGRVLRDGGTFVVTFTNSRSVLHPISRRLTPARFRRPPLSLPVTSYRESDARAALGAAQLEVERMDRYNCFVSVRTRMVPPPAVALAAERVLRGRAAELLCRNFVLTARRADLAVSAPSRSLAEHVRFRRA